VPTIAEAFDIALEMHRAGNFPGAEQIYRQILEVDPRHANSLHLLGVLLHQQGQNETALQLIEAAVAIDPTAPAFFSNLGEVYRALGRLDDAVASQRQALRIDPRFVEAYNNLGVALDAQGNFEEAVTAYQQALQLRPDFSQVHNNLGNALRDLQQLDQAIVCYRRSLQLDPNFAAAYNNFGNAVQLQGHIDDAIVLYNHALSLKPDFAEVHYNLGNALKDKQQLLEATKKYELAARLKPDYPEAHNNLGNILHSLGRRSEALDHYRVALRVKRDYAEARSNLLFALNYDPSIDDESLFVEHRRYGEVHDLPNLSPVYPNSRDPGRRLRIGYVSPDFRRHPVAYFIEPILQHHSSQETEVFLYSQAERFDDVTARIRTLPHAWRDIRHQSDKRAAEMIRADQVDILVDLAGHTAQNRLLVFALRSAPLQVTYLGFPNTTGMKSIQYLLTDSVTDPEDEPARYTEEVVRLSAGYCCFLPPPEAREVNPLPALSRGYVTFGSLHTLPKLNAGVLELWCEILRAVPQSCLLLFRDTLEGATGESFAREFAERGIPVERVEIRHKIPAGGLHLPVYEDIDITLDTFPWCGHTTACESLWMGVPIVTLRGHRHAGRLVTSVLQSAGLPDWVTTTPAEYVQRAVRAAADVEALAQLRQSLRPMVAASALCDAARFTRSIEEAYRQIWRTWCADAAPRAGE
jgi:protein O-GlcNAc transferase